MPLGGRGLLGYPSGIAGLPEFATALDTASGTWHSKVGAMVLSAVVSALTAASMVAEDMTDGVWLDGR